MSIEQEKGVFQKEKRQFACYVALHRSYFFLFIYLFGNTYIKVTLLLCRILDIDGFTINLSNMVTGCKFSNASIPAFITLT